MIDALSIPRIKLLHPKLRDEALKIYNETSKILTGGAYCRITHTLRTFEQQNELYKIGREKLFDEDGNRIGIVTKAKGGQSFHNYALAIDFCLMESRTASWDINKDFDKDGKADWMEVIAVFKRYGWESGADWKFKDFPHLQKTFGYTTKQLLEKWNKGETFIDNGIKYVKL